jgi:hypothetical protein
MRTLAIIPDRATTVAFLPAARGQQLDAPSVLFGKTEARQARALSTSWSNLTPNEFAYMLAFWRTATKCGTVPFWANLPIDGQGAVLCRAAFGGNLSIRGVTGGTASLACQLYATPVAYTHYTDAAAEALVAAIASEA